VRGDKEARAGIEKLWGMSGGDALAAHRVFIYEEGAAEKTQDGRTQDPRTGEWKPRKGIDAKKLRAERARGGRLPVAAMLRMRVRYMTAGGIIGSKTFVREVARAQGEEKAGTAMRRGDWGGLRSLRNLQRRVFGAAI
jgi:hypothetical protein